MIFEEPVKVNSRQLKYFSVLWADNTVFAQGHGNNRNPQKLNGRRVYYVNQTGQPSYRWIIIISVIVFGVIVIIIGAVV